MLDVSAEMSGAEAGVVAASLARDGFTGPTTVLEGDFGILNVFGRDADLSRLTDGLGETFETLNLCIKRFPCHITAHTPVQAVLDLKAEHGFGGHEVEAVEPQGQGLDGVIVGEAEDEDGIASAVRVVQHAGKRFKIELLGSRRRKGQESGLEEITNQ